MIRRMIVFGLSCILLFGCSVSKSPNKVQRLELIKSVPDIVFIKQGTGVWASSKNDQISENIAIAAVLAQSIHERDQDFVTVFNLLRSVSQKLRAKGIINEQNAIDYLASKR